jgi:hypothetical protein
MKKKKRRQILDAWSDSLSANSRWKRKYRKYVTKESTGFEKDAESLRLPGEGGMDRLVDYLKNFWRVRSNT